jgi:hypothetical protein
VLVSVENEWPPMGKESRHDGAILMRRIEQQRAARTEYAEAIARNVVTSDRAPYPVHRNIIQRT